MYEQLSRPARSSEAPKPYRGNFLPPYDYDENDLVIATGRLITVGSRKTDDGTTTLVLGYRPREDN